MNRIAVICALAVGASPLHGIVVIAGNDPNASILKGNNDFFNGMNMSGVVMVTTNFGSCSGAVIGDFSVLTAGHCVGSAFGAGFYNNPQVTFVGPSNNGPFTGGYDVVGVSSIAVDPLWNGDPALGGDLAVVHLSQIAPSYATRYSLYTGLALPATSPIVMAGFGLSGTGATGADSATYDFGNLRAGTNEYVTTGANALFGWSANLLIGQFYDVLHPSTNALGVTGPYSSNNEVDIAHGDSGGPSFYNGQIIGVHDIGDCLSASSSGPCLDPPSISTVENSYYGQLFGDVSVAGNLAFIEAQLAPEPASAVLTLLGLGVAGLWRVRSRINGLRRP